MNQCERNALLKEIKRLRLAASDMDQVAAATATLAEVRLNGGAERIMYTGIVVAYVRPYRNAGIGELNEAEWAPHYSDRALHDRLVFLRDKVYAHTDDTVYRGVEDTSSLLDIDGGPTYAESYVSMSPEGIQRIGQIAEAQAKRFSHAADELEHQLGRPRPDGSGQGWNI